MKNLLNNCCVALLFTFTSLSVHAQIEGMWEVQQVSIGTVIKTPVAKWLKFEKDQTFTTGNGWQQHSFGTYTYNKSTRTLTNYTVNEPEDEDGPFTVSFPDSNTMEWRRMEDGDQVTVIAKRITTMPSGPADKIKGLWNLSKAIKDDKDITAQFNPGNNHCMFIRWDRIFVEWRNGKESRRGVWHMAGHDPILELITNEEIPKREKWEVFFEQDKVVFKGLSPSNTGYTLSFVTTTKFCK